MRPQIMTVLALVCLGGASPAVSAPSEAPSEVLPLPSTRAASQVALWPARETSQPMGIELLASGQWIPVRGGRWLWVAHDQGSERAAPSLVVAHQYTYFPGIGWRRVAASGGPDPALFAHTPFGEFSAMAGTPALGFGSLGRARN